MDQEASSQRTYANLAPKKVMSKKEDAKKHIFGAEKWNYCNFSRIFARFFVAGFNDDRAAVGWFLITY